MAFTRLDLAFSRLQLNIENENFWAVRGLRVTDCPSKWAKNLPFFTILRK
jgi:hypothetical protein